MKLDCLPQLRNVPKVLVENQLRLTGTFGTLCMRKELNKKHGDDCLRDLCAK
jgi:hypothetical protein